MQWSESHSSGNGITSSDVRIKPDQPILCLCSHSPSTRLTLTSTLSGMSSHPLFSLHRDSTASPIAFLTASAIELHCDLFHRHLLAPIRTTHPMEIKIPMTNPRSYGQPVLLVSYRPTSSVKRLTMKLMAMMNPCHNPAPACAGCQYLFYFTLYNTLAPWYLYIMP